jgi:hypothetical protein
MWQEKTNPQSGVKLSIPTTAEFLIGPHKLRIHEISIKFWWVFFFSWVEVVGVGVLLGEFRVGHWVWVVGVVSTIFTPFPSSPNSHQKTSV